MQCVATLANGKPCCREAQPHSERCQFHDGVELRRRARRFYTTQLSEDEQEALLVAAQLEGVDAEIAILRVLIRRVISAGDLDAARRGIETLCRSLKARHELDERSTDQLAASLERVLDNLGRDLDVKL
ncbi:MAG TPA: hypothetical protein VFC51_07250 [Chloroflexota bacterium]|nr:hypothetical protein [Chloroflexota bacterium]